VLSALTSRLGDTDVVVRRIALEGLAISAEWDLGEPRAAVARR